MSADIQLNSIVRHTLEHPEDHEWTVQGLGMMRTYFGEACRLHVWDSSLKEPNASEIHDHPWDFTSTTVTGVLENYRYKVVAGRLPYDRISEDHKPGDVLMNRVQIRCGEGGCELSKLSPVWLRPSNREIYSSGGGYGQTAQELHKTMFRDGTVTVITRRFNGPVRDLATVCMKGEWVSAEPRPATDEEVERVVGKALKVGGWGQ